MQKLFLIGNLGSDAEVKEANGRLFTRFSVADSQRFTKADGTEVESTTWISCIKDGDCAKLLPYLRMGTKVYVEGRPSYRVYSSPKERAMVAGVDLHVFTLELVGGGSSDDVPAKLVNPDGGAIVPVNKLFFVEGLANCQLFGERGGSFNVDNRGLVTKVIDNAQTNS